MQLINVQYIIKQISKQMLMNPHFNLNKPNLIAILSQKGIISCCITTSQVSHLCLLSRIELIVGSSPNYVKCDAQLCAWFKNHTTCRSAAVLRSSVCSTLRNLKSTTFPVFLSWVDVLCRG